MPYNEKLADRIRKSVGHIPDVDEKKMFRGITFMVNGKMCVSVSGDDLMCRIDPAMYEKAMMRKGCRPVIMKGREFKGYVYVSEEGMKAQKDFDYWIGLALDFNKIAKPAPKRRKK